MASNREEGPECSVTVRITDNTEITDDCPSGWSPGPEDGDYGPPGGDEDEYDPKHESEPGAEFNWCVPDGVSDDPSEEELAKRFAKALEHYCACEEVCVAEFDIYDTIQSYDDASGRKKSEIVIKDYELEEGSPEYWEKYAELKAEALAECIEQCACLPAMTWDTENSPETIIAGESIDLFVLNGRGLYTWAVSGKGYRLASENTVTGQNQ